MANTFIDLQINGHGGIDFLSVNSIDEVRTACRSLHKHGVAGFLPTLITSNPIQLKNAAKFITEVSKSHHEDEARILGFHLEGPFISTDKRGVHPEHYILQPDLELAADLLSIGNVKIVTLAPELPGALDLIDYLVNKGIVVSLGHSNATMQEAHAGFDAGATTVTHIYNAMSKTNGLAEVALLRDDVVVQMIVDDVHLSRTDVIGVVERASGRFIMTNDTIAAAGLGAGTFPFGEMIIEVRDGKALRGDGTLAGGIGDLYQSIQIMRELGVEEPEITASITSRPTALIS